MPLLKMPMNMQKIIENRKTVLSKCDFDKKL